MSNIFSQYISMFLHPFRTHEILRQQRSSKVISLSPTGIGIYEGISVSWIFYIIYSLYSFITIFLGAYLYQRMSNESMISFIVDPSEQRMLLLKTIFAVAVFPLSTWIWVRFWALIIHFFANLFMVEGDSKKISDEIACNAMVSHALMVIPVFGAFAFHLGSLVFIYAGLRRNLGLTLGQAMVVLIAPMAILLMLLFFMFISLAMLLMGL